MNIIIYLFSLSLIGLVEQQKIQPPKNGWMALGQIVVVVVQEEREPLMMMVAVLSLPIC